MDEHLKIIFLNIKFIYFLIKIYCNRSKTLLKVKTFHDEEVIIIGYKKHKNCN